jgi:predicted HicB family RNase H-like nuclease
MTDSETERVTQINVRVPRSLKRRLRLVTADQDTTTQAFVQSVLEIAVAAAERRAA